MAQGRLWRPGGGPKQRTARWCYATWVLKGEDGDISWKGLLKGLLEALGVISGAEGYEGLQAQLAIASFLELLMVIFCGGVWKIGKHIL